MRVLLAYKMCNMIRLLKFVIAVPTFLLIGCTNEDDSFLVTWIMVGVNNTTQQADAHLISGGGKVILIDTGHQNTIHALFNELKFRNIDYIDAVFITHPHSDHYGGLVDLIKSKIGIGVIYMNDVSQEWMKREWWGGNYGDLVEIRENAMLKNISISTYDKFESFYFNEKCKFNKLFIFSEEELLEKGIGPDINELSLISELKYGEYKALFTGDLNTKLSNWLLENEKEQIWCDVLKVPHHGTEGLASNDFFQATEAKICLVPSPTHLWESNRSSRPREVFKKMGSKVFLNGELGSVTVEFRSSGVRVHSSTRRNLFSLNKINKFF